MDSQNNNEVAQITRNSDGFITWVKEGKTYHISKTHNKEKFCDIKDTFEKSTKKGYRHLVCPVDFTYDNGEITGFVTEKVQTGTNSEINDMEIFDFIRNYVRTTIDIAEMSRYRLLIKDENLVDIILEGNNFYVDLLAALEHDPHLNVGECIDKNMIKFNQVIINALKNDLDITEGIIVQRKFQGKVNILLRYSDEIKENANKKDSKVKDYVRRSIKEGKRRK